MVVSAKNVKLLVISVLLAKCYAFIKFASHKFVIPITCSMLLVIFCPGNILVGGAKTDKGRRN